MATLYRQYRPTTFAEIAGQPHITNALERAIESERVAQAYLFHGPRGTGKTTTARVFAKRLNCTKATSAEPCGKCDLCIATAEGKNLDLIEIDAASNRGIDDIRALKEGIGLAPAMGKYKVYIIDEVHMLTNEAFTALLKTLEEPVAHAIFILATTEFHKVPETIISRCQVYRFRRASDDELRERLNFLLTQEKRKVDDDALDFVAQRGDGCYRDAESLLGQVLTVTKNTVKLSDVTEFLGLPSREIIDRFLTALVAQAAPAAVKALDEAFADGFDPEQLLQESIRMAREGALALLAQEKYDGAFVQTDGAMERLPQILRVLVQAMQDLAYVPQPLVALHLAVLTTCATPAQPVSTTTEKPVQESTTAPRAAQPPTQQVEARGRSVVTSQAGDLEVEQVKKVWPKLIAAVKLNNPVASTFLRAMEPMAVEGIVLRVAAQYTLHRNFFEKEENRRPLQEALAELLSQPLEVRVVLNEETKAVPGARQEKQATELLSAVKEVFGAETATEASS